jgi:hypothetical protein
VRAVVPPKPHFQDCTCSPSTSLSSRPSTVDRCKSPQLDRQNRYLSLQPWPFSLCRHLLDNRARGDQPQLAVGGAVGRQWRRRGALPAAACVVAAGCAWPARGRRVYHLMRPGELGAGVPRAAQLARVLGAGVRGVCTSGRAVVSFASVLTVDCEPRRAARARTEDAKYVPATLFVGRPNYTID